MLYAWAGFMLVVTCARNGFTARALESGLTTWKPSALLSVGVAARKTWLTTPRNFTASVGHRTMNLGMTNANSDVDSN